MIGTIPKLINFSFETIRVSSKLVILVSVVTFFAKTGLLSKVVHFFIQTDLEDFVISDNDEISKNFPIEIKVPKRRLKKIRIVLPPWFPSLIPILRLLKRIWQSKDSDGFPELQKAPDFDLELEDLDDFRD